MKGQANPNYSANAFKGYLMGTATRGELGTVIRGNHPTLAKLTALYRYRNVNCLFMGPMAQHPLGRMVFSHDSITYFEVAHRWRGIQEFDLYIIPAKFQLGKIFTQLSRQHLEIRPSPLACTLNFATNNAVVNK